MENLSEYNKKRNFEKTTEPKGENHSNSEGLRFVVQHHMARRDHYDFRLEWKGSMLSWAVPKGPSFKPTDKRLAIKVEDHPIEYRNFEGIIPKGQYGGGTVMIWDEGYWQPYGSDVDQALKEGVIKFVLSGIRLVGKWCLIRLKDSQTDKENWILFKENDSYAKDTDGIVEFKTSIITGRSMEEIQRGDQQKTKKNPFNTASVQLAKFSSVIPEGNDWVFEIKYDGYRIISYIEVNQVQLLSRNGKDYTKHFPLVVNSLLEMAGGAAMILDGEITATDSSENTSFQALQNYIKNPRDKNLTYFIFDMLALNGDDIRKQSLIHRKEKLQSIMKRAPKNLQYSQHFYGNGKQVFVAACQASMEGIVGKKANSIYSGIKNNDWIKIKCDKRQEFVIGGYTISEKRTIGISSLLLGVFEDGELIFYGRSGTGLSMEQMKDLQQRFEKIKNNNCPFKECPKSKPDEAVFFVLPELVAEIKFTELTEEGLLRQASFKGLRFDKSPNQVVNEEKDEQTLIGSSEYNEEREMQNNYNDILQKIKITSPDKIIFEQPNITKREVLEYYAKVAHRMLPYMSNRVLSIVRCPKGINEACFYKKHPAPGSKGISTIAVSSENSENKEYFYIENEVGLLNEAQMGTLEFHIWGSSVEQIDKPDMMVFDLDPDEGMELATVRQGVKDLKVILNQLSINAYLKTSGGKGYHVVAPFIPSPNWQTFHDFAKNIAQVMEIRWPNRYTSNMRKVKRSGKIFIDWVRNARGATSIAPYSLRARKGAAVSMPIAWEELDTIAPDGIDIKKALLRLEEKDPWKDFFNNKQQLH